MSDIAILRDASEKAAAQYHAQAALMAEQQPTMEMLLRLDELHALTVAADHDLMAALGAK